MVSIGFNFFKTNLSALLYSIQKFLMFSRLNMCKDKSCPAVEYNKVVTGGNNPQITQKMFLAQRVRATTYSKVNGAATEKQLLARGIIPYGTPTYVMMPKL